MSGLRSHLRQNTFVYVLLVIALTGGTAFAAGLARNSVESKHIAPNAVKGKDVAIDTLEGRHIKEQSLSFKGQPIRHQLQVGTGFFTQQTFSARGITFKFRCMEPDSTESIAQLAFESTKTGVLDANGTRSDTPSGSFSELFTTPKTDDTQIIELHSGDGANGGRAQGNILWTRTNGTGLHLYFSIRNIELTNACSFQGFLTRSGV